MRKLFTLLSVACAMVCMVACSSSQSSPESATEKYIKAMQDKDVDAIIELMYVEEEPEGYATMLAEFKTLLENEIFGYFDQLGGVKSYTIEPAQLSDDGTTANVDCTVTFGNGDTEESTLEVLLRDGRWYVDEF